MGVYSFLFSVSNVLIKGCSVADVMEDPKYSARNLSINHKARAAFLCCYPATALVYNSAMCIASWGLCCFAICMAIVILFPFVPTQTEATVFTTYDLDQFLEWRNEDVCIIQNRVRDRILLAQQTWVTYYYFDDGGDIFPPNRRRTGTHGGLYEQVPWRSHIYPLLFLFNAVRDEAHLRLFNVVHRTAGDLSAFPSNCSFVCQFVDMLVLDAALRGLNDSEANYNVSSCVNLCQSADFANNMFNGPNVLPDDVDYTSVFDQVVCFSNKDVDRGSQEIANDRFFAFMNFFSLIRTFGAWIILGFLMPFALFSRFMNHVVARRKTKKDELQLDSFKHDPDSTIIDYVPPEYSDNDV